MPAPHNPFKAALKNGDTVIGCWLSLGDPLATEIAGTAGFDWLLIDSEHTPYDITRIRMQLMALQASDSHPAVRTWRFSPDGAVNFHILPELWLE